MVVPPRYSISPTTLRGSASRLTVAMNTRRRPYRSPSRPPPSSAPTAMDSVSMEDSEPISSLPGPRWSLYSTNADPVDTIAAASRYEAIPATPDRNHRAPGISGF